MQTSPHNHIGVHWVVADEVAVQFTFIEDSSCGSIEDLFYYTTNIFKHKLLVAHPHRPVAKSLFNQE